MADNELLLTDPKVTGPNVAITITHEQLVTLTAWMVGHGYTAADVAYAVEKPWKFWPDYEAYVAQYGEDVR